MVRLVAGCHLVCTWVGELKYLVDHGGRDGPKFTQILPLVR